MEINFWTDYALPGVIIIGKILLIIVPLLVAIAYLTYAERKVLALMQLRQGPNVVGPFGLLQPMADGIKLLNKETIVPAGANRAVFLAAPMLTFLLSLSAWAVIPFGEKLVLANINVGVLYLFAISSLGVYGVMMAGWASNSKYSFLGGLRSAAQMVSYEVSLGLVIVTVLLTVGSLNLSDIVTTRQPWWLWLLLSPMMVVFFMGEYGNMLLMGAMTSILFLGGWLPPLGLMIAPLTWVPGIVWFGLKIALCMFIFLWIRATFPRYRYDQLMRLGWKIFLPFSLIWVVLVAGVMLMTGYHAPH
jgi:NADH-quinone oxidoreductase subunit H